MKHRLSIVGLGAAVLIIGAGVAVAMGILNLPGDPVMADHGPWNQGSNSTIDVTLSGVPAGFDVMDGMYPGWCIEDNLQPDLDGEVTLLDSTDTDPLVCGDLGYPGYQWDKINYLLNHKAGTIEDIQVAMWLLAGTYYGGTFEITQAVTDMVDDADANGAGFVPGPGEIVAVVLCVDGDSGPDSYQDTIIELELPDEDFQGCTPGYWKNHPFAWLATGYQPDDDYGDVFGVTDSRDLTLMEALRIGGGGERALYRHATAALLNAASPDVFYPYTPDQVIAMVQSAYATGMFEETKDMFEVANEAGCPLGNGSVIGRARFVANFGAE